MANSKQKCRYCKEFKQAHKMVSVPLGYFCHWGHAVKHGQVTAKAAQERLMKKRASELKKTKKVLRAKHRADLDRVKRRSDWYKMLQILVNQYVRYRDRDEPCCTCGTMSQTIKYDAGHFFTVAARPDLRFNLINIHKQCSIKCNVHGSGMRLEYEKFIVKKYGQIVLDALVLEGRPLKEQYPHYDDIKKEISHFRAILREVGIKPNT